MTGADQNGCQETKPIGNSVYRRKGSGWEGDDRVVAGRGMTATS